VDFLATFLTNSPPLLVHSLQVLPAIRAVSHPFKVPEKIAKAEEYKLKGNEAFKLGNLKEALRNYHVATIHIKGLMQTSEDQKKSIDAINLACQSNMV
jgi:hypothetical protein